MKLYSYFRSSAAYRVRIGLNLKGLAAEIIPVHLRHNEQHAPDYAALNPQHLVPLLEDGPHRLIQSLAILEYLEETRPEPAILPPDPAGRARVRALAQVIACEIHPLDNLRVLRYLVRDLKVTNEAKDQWYRHWIVEGFDALEKLLAGAPETGRFCHGDMPGLADICLVPQVNNARLAGMDIAPWPTIQRIAAACAEIPAFAAAHPSKQPDAE
jgi:maleylpyruvate isomerase